MTRIRRQVYVGSLLGFVVGAALSAPLAQLLAIHSTSGLVETFAAGALWTVVCYERALLQARKAYPPFAANLLLEGVLRCIVTVVAVAATLGSPGQRPGCWSACRVPSPMPGGQRAGSPCRRAASRGTWAT